MKSAMAILTCLVLAACGGGADDSKDDEQKVFEPLIESVDKAKAVEDTVLQQKEDMDEAMRRMEDGDDDSTEDP